MSCCNLFLVTQFLVMMLTFLGSEAAASLCPALVVSRTSSSIADQGPFKSCLGAL